MVVSPPELALQGEFKAELEERDVAFREVESVEACIADADVIYMEPVVQADYTQARVDPSTEHGVTPPAYQVTRALLHDKARRDAIILHSLPRMDELPADVDSTRHARYWFEAYNGVVMRMALLALVLGAVE
jgi:aspartate carbamoyltransferase catalytic subunit